jgi:hypothetical protein
MTWSSVHSGEGRQLFGDVADGFGFDQVDGGDVVGGEEDALASVAARWSDRDAFAPEGFRHFP